MPVTTRSKGKENNIPIGATQKAKPAPDFSKLHKQWNSKLQKGKAVTKKPLTGSQPFQLSSTNKTPNKENASEKSPKPDDGKRPNQRQENLQYKRATIGVCGSRPVTAIQGSIPRSSFLTNRSSSRQEKPLQTIPQSIQTAQQIQGFSVDFKSDKNALDSILNGDGLPFNNSPAKKSGQFGPLAKQKRTDRIAPFPRGSLRGPAVRASLNIKTTAAQNSQPQRWSIFSRDSFSTKPDLLAWLKDIADNPRAHYRPVKEVPKKEEKPTKQGAEPQNDVAIEETQHNPVVSKAEPSTSSYNATVIGFQGSPGNFTNIQDGVKTPSKLASIASGVKKSILKASATTVPNQRNRNRVNFAERFSEMTIAKCSVVSSPLQTNTILSTSAVSSSKKVSWADSTLTKGNVTMVRSSHKIPYQIPAEHPDCETHPVNDKRPNTDTQPVTETHPVNDNKISHLSTSTNINDYMSKISNLDACQNVTSEIVNNSAISDTNDSVLIDSPSRAINSPAFETLLNRTNSRPLPMLSDNVVHELINLSSDDNFIESPQQQQQTPVRWNNTALNTTETPQIGLNVSTFNKSTLAKAPTKNAITKARTPYKQFQLLDDVEKRRKMNASNLMDSTIVDQQQQATAQSAPVKIKKVKKRIPILEEIFGSDLEYVDDSDDSHVVQVKKKKSRKKRISILEEIFGSDLEYVDDDEDDEDEEDDETNLNKDVFGNEDSQATNTSTTSCPSTTLPSHSTPQLSPKPTLIKPQSLDAPTLIKNCSPNSSTLVKSQSPNFSKLVKSQSPQASTLLNKSQSPNPSTLAKTHSPSLQKSITTPVSLNKNNISNETNHLPPTQNVRVSKLSTTHELNAAALLKTPVHQSNIERNHASTLIKTQSPVHIYKNKSDVTLVGETNHVPTLTKAQSPVHKSTILGDHYPTTSNVQTPTRLMQSSPAPQQNILSADGQSSMNFTSLGFVLSVPDINSVNINTSLFSDADIKFAAGHTSQPSQMQLNGNSAPTWNDILKPSKLQSASSQAVPNYFTNDFTRNNILRPSKLGVSKDVNREIKKIPTHVEPSITRDLQQPSINSNLLNTFNSSSHPASPQSKLSLATENINNSFFTDRAFVTSTGPSTDSIRDPKFFSATIAEHSKRKVQSPDLMAGGKQIINRPILRESQFGSASTSRPDHQTPKKPILKSSSLFPHTAADLSLSCEKENMVPSRIPNNPIKLRPSALSNVSNQIPNKSTPSCRPVANALPNRTELLKESSLTTALSENKCETPKQQSHTESHPLFHSVQFSKDPVLENVHQNRNFFQAKFTPKTVAVSATINTTLNTQSGNETTKSLNDDHVDSRNIIINVANSCPDGQHTSDRGTNIKNKTLLKSSSLSESVQGEGTIPVNRSPLTLQKSHCLFGQAQFPINPVFDTSATAPRDISVSFSVQSTRDLSTITEQEISIDDLSMLSEQDMCIKLPPKASLLSKKPVLGIGNSAFKYIAPKCNVFPKYTPSNLPARALSEEMKRLQGLRVSTEGSAMIDAELAVYSKFGEINNMLKRDMDERPVRDGAMNPLAVLLTTGDQTHFVPVEC